MVRLKMLRRVNGQHRYGTPLGREVTDNIVNTNGTAIVRWKRYAVTQVQGFQAKADYKGSVRRGIAE